MRSQRSVQRSPCVALVLAAAGSLGILGRNGLYTQEDLLNKW
jgi:hypothetical protein